MLGGACGRTRTFPGVRSAADIFERSAMIRSPSFRFSLEAPRWTVPCPATDSHEVSRRE